MHEKPDKNKTPKNSLNEYAKYSNMAFRMVAIIVVGVFAGIKLDQYMENKIPVFIIIFSIASVSIALYLFIKDLIKK